MKTINDFNRPLKPRPPKDEKPQAEIELAHRSGLAALIASEPNSVDLISVACFEKTCEYPLHRFWKEVKRVLKPTGNIIITGTDKFMALICLTAPHDYRSHEYVLPLFEEEIRHTRRPVENHLRVVVYQPTYLSYYKPQLQDTSHAEHNPIIEKHNPIFEPDYSAFRYPHSLLDIHRHLEWEDHRVHNVYIELYEYLYMTYSKPNAKVLDLCPLHSYGATAALKTGRSYHGFIYSYLKYEAARNELDWASKHIKHITAH